MTEPDAPRWDRLIIFLVLDRYVVRGLTFGSVKG